MKLIKRCYGCGKILWPWQDTVDTKLVGIIHNGCAFNASIIYSIEKENTEFMQRVNEGALTRLNAGGDK